MTIRTLSPLTKSVFHELAIWLKDEIEKQLLTCDFLETKDDCFRFCINKMECALIDPDDEYNVRLWFWDNMERVTWGDDNISVPKVTQCMGWRFGERFELADPTSFDRILKKILSHFNALKREE